MTMPASPPTEPPSNPMPPPQTPTSGVTAPTEVSPLPEVLQSAPAPTPTSTRMAAPPLGITPSPALVPPAPIHRTSLITHRFQDDNLIPVLGQLIKIRLDTPLDGPGSSRVSSPAPTRSTKQNYHSALVLSISMDFLNQALSLKVFPIPAYTGARHLGLTSQAWVTQLEPEMRRKHIPMPYINGDDINTTPTEFGDPIRPVCEDGRYYHNRVPSWIIVHEYSVQLPWARIWKSHTPEVRFTLSDIDRLQRYATRLQVLGNSNSYNQNPMVNMLRLPDECHHPRGIFEELYAGFGGVEQNLPEEDDDDGEDEDEPEVYGLDFLRMIGTQDETIRRWVMKEEEKIRKEKEARVEEWLRDTT